MEESKPAVKEDDANLSEFLTKVIPLVTPTIEKYAQSYAQASEKRFNKLFGFAVFITTTIFAFAGGLIFYTDRIDTGIAILTHVVALLAGAIGGGAFLNRRE